MGHLRRMPHSIFKFPLDRTGKRNYSIRRKLNTNAFLLFRVMEIHRICEVTATPETEGAYLSEQSNNKGI